MLSPALQAIDSAPSSSCPSTSQASGSAIPSCFCQLPSEDVRLKSPDNDLLPTPDWLIVIAPSLGCRSLDDPQNKVSESRDTQIDRVTTTRASPSIPPSLHIEANCSFALLSQRHHLRKAVDSGQLARSFRVAPDAFSECPQFTLLSDTSFSRNAHNTNASHTACGYSATYSDGDDRGRRQRAGLGRSSCEKGLGVADLGLTQLHV
ncbi:hypothetical protein C8F01DRAFT_1251384 [Mycena amicta]|nr:hypothetical protein C8F01DRAFT_1251384 [Mycena amicta]